MRFTHPTTLQHTVYIHTVSTAHTHTHTNIYIYTFIYTHTHTHTHSYIHSTLAVQDFFRPALDFGGVPYPSADLDFQFFSPAQFHSKTAPSIILINNHTINRAFSTIPQRQTVLSSEVSHACPCASSIPTKDWIRGVHGYEKCPRHTHTLSLSLSNTLCLFSHTYTHAWARAQQFRHHWIVLCVYSTHSRKHPPGTAQLHVQEIGNTFRARSADRGSKRDTRNAREHTHTHTHLSTAHRYVSVRDSIF